MKNNNPRGVTTFEKFCNDVHFYAGLSDALRGLPFREFSCGNAQWRYERARQFVALQRSEGNARKYMQGARCAAWVVQEFAAARASRLIL